MPIKLLSTSFLLFLFFAFPNSSIGQKVPRLVAYAHSYYDGSSYAATDSGTLTYKPGMGYYAKTASFQFDTNKIYVYQVPYSIYAHLIKEYEVYDGVKKNNLMRDVTQKMKVSDSSWVDSLQYVYAYDANDNLLTKTQQVWYLPTSYWKNVDRYVYSYDASNNTLSKLYQVWSVNGWLSIYNHDYTYDSYNNVSSDIYKLSDTVSKIWINTTYTTYTYNTKNKPVTSVIKYWTSASSSWRDSILNTYNYDAAGNKLFTKVREVYKSSILELDSNVVFSYDTVTNDIVSELWQFFYVYPTTWKSSIIYNYTYDANHNMTSKVRQDYILKYSGDYWQPVDSVVYTYNNYHQVTSYLSSRWYVPSTSVMGFWQPVLGDGYHRYYYEMETGVNNIETAKGELNLYPLPANDIMSIDITWDKEQEAVIGIFDINGKLWNQWQTNKSSNYHKGISVSQMPAGTYIMSVQTEGGKISKIFTIAH